MSLLNIATHFKAFVAAENVVETMQAFQHLLQNCRQLEKSENPKNNAVPLSTYFLIKTHVLQSNIPFRLRKLFRELDIRVNSQTLQTIEKRNKQKKVFICGAGPVGLRAAIENLINGHFVTIVEKRDDFSRLNVIKTWPVTLDDLFQLGMSVYLPNFKTNGVSHCGTRDMQNTLFKTALLFGVEAFFNHQVIGIARPLSCDDCWSVVVLPSNQIQAKKDALSFVYGRSDVSNLQQYSLVDFVELAASDSGAVLSPQQVQSLADEGGSDSVRQFECDVLLVAEGERSKLITQLGFDRKIQRFKSAIGLVINLDLGEHKNDHKFKVKVQSVANAASTELLVKLGGQRVAVENVEVLRSSEAFFIVCTVLPETLVTHGVLKEAPLEGHRVVLKRDNIDQEALKSLAKTIALACDVPEPHVFRPVNGLQLFDFSAKGCCVQKSRAFHIAPDNSMLVTDAEHSQSKEALQSMASLLVMPIGDALQNPYWPQGLGVNSGFHSAMDSAHVVNTLCESDSIAASQAECDFAFLARCFSFRLASFLRPAKQWQSALTTRYQRELFKQIHFSGLNNRQTSLLPDFYLKHYGFKQFD